MSSAVVDKLPDEKLEQCHSDGRDLGRKVLDLLDSGMVSGRVFPFMTEDNECHRLQHEGFLSVVGIDGIMDDRRPDVVKIVGGCCLVREMQVGVQIGDNGELIEFPQGWNYYIRPVDSPGSDTE